ncbi:MAG: hypothetical protein AAF211_02810 [Myxococcota bacterium]
MDPDERLLAALDGDETGPAVLQAALDVWAACRQPEVAALVRRQDEAVRKTTKGPKGRTKEAFHGAWLALAESDDSAAATGWLCSTLRAKLPIEVDRYGLLDVDYVFTKYAALFARLEALHDRCPDPRIATAVIELLARGEYGNWAWEESGVEVIYRPMVELVVRAGDPDAAAVLRPMIAAPRAKLAAVRDWLTSQLPGLVAKLDGIPRTALPEPLVAALAPKGRSRRAENAEEASVLLERVREDPSDLDARAVLADIWAEAGDPRGAFVNRQLQGHGEDDKEVRRLLRAHRAEWLGPDLASTLKVTFANGFPHTGELKVNHSAAEAVWRAASADERLVTIEVLRQGKGNKRWYERFVSSGAMRNLAVAEVPSKAIFEGLAQRETASLRMIELGIAPNGPITKALAQRIAFANVRELGLPATVSLGPWLEQVAKAGLSGRFEALTVFGPRVRRWGAAPPKAEVLRLWPQICAALPNLQRFTLRHVALLSATFTRDGDGWHLTLFAPDDQPMFEPLLLDGPVWRSLDVGVEPGPLAGLRFRGGALPVEPLDRPAGVVRVSCPATPDVAARLAERWKVPVDVA